MKRIMLFALIGLFAGLLTPATAQDIKDKLAAEACDCIGEKDTDNMSTEDLQMQLSMCLMEAVGNNQAAFQEEYGTLNPSDQETMQKLGQDIGMRMVTKCPQYMMKLANQQAPPQSAAPAPTKKASSLQGTIKAVGGDEVAIVTVVEDNGRSHKLLWLDFFPGSDRLQNPSEAVGKKVTVEYQEMEVYSPKAKEYFKRKKIAGIRFE